MCEINGLKNSRRQQVPLERGQLYVPRPSPPMMEHVAGSAHTPRASPPAWPQRVVEDSSGNNTVINLNIETFITILKIQIHTF